MTSQIIINKFPNTLTIMLCAYLQAQEDERSLCHSDWSNEASMDQPSYGSIILQIQEANTEAEGSCDFVRKTLEIIGNTSM